jgi:hypothetical protein
MWFALLPVVAVAQDKLVWSEARYEIDAESWKKFEDIEVMRDSRLADWFEKAVASSDKSPPEVRIWVLWEDSAGETHDEGLLTTAGRQISVPEGSTVVLLASANEYNGGALDNLWIEGETTSSCEDSQFGQRADALWGVQNPDPDTTDADFYDWRLVALDFAVPPFACAPGMWFVGGSGDFRAHALNHGGLTSSTGWLHIEFVP